MERSRVCEFVSQQLEMGDGTGSDRKRNHADGANDITGHSKDKNNGLCHICTNLHFSNPKAMIYYRCSISECMIATAFTESN